MLSVQCAMRIETSLGLWGLVWACMFTKGPWGICSQSCVEIFHMMQWKIALDYINNHEKITTCSVCHTHADIQQSCCWNTFHIMFSSTFISTLRMNMTTIGDWAVTQSSSSFHSVEPSDINTYWWKWSGIHWIIISDTLYVTSSMLW